MINKPLDKRQNIEKICIEKYNYNLPDDRIAAFPLQERDKSKLLVYKAGVIKDTNFRNLSQQLPKGTTLIFNNTRVIQARLRFKKPTGSTIEIFCLEPIVPNDYQLSFGCSKTCIWKCLIGNLKRWKNTVLSAKAEFKGEIFELKAERLATEGNIHDVRFSWDNENISFAEVLSAFGELPIPPYLNRPTEEADKTTYQTVYSKVEGSVAAPTAGLHFTDRVLTSLEEEGVIFSELTLHVGAGTFQPVKSKEIGDHDMHTEFISVKRSTIEKVQQNLGNVIAVGTTSVRTLESLYFLGCQLHKGDTSLSVAQWDPYKIPLTLSAESALQAIIDYLDVQGLDCIYAHTQILIAPGYEFRIIRGMLTNFHQPKSTLLLLLAAYVGDDWKNIYNFAMDNAYRFLSYGDSSLLLK